MKILFKGWICYMNLLQTADSIDRLFIISIK